VSITLKGNHATTPTLPLAGSSSALASGSSNAFEHVLMPLGELQSASISISSATWQPSWHLSHVVVRVADYGGEAAGAALSEHVFFLRYAPKSPAPCPGCQTIAW
jgi:hypothetical protein